VRDEWAYRARKAAKLRACLEFPPIKYKEALVCKKSSGLETGKGKIACTFVCSFCIFPAVLFRTWLCANKNKKYQKLEFSVFHSASFGVFGQKKFFSSDYSHGDRSGRAERGGYGGCYGAYCRIQI
jgi:hypothetical protein